MTTYLSVQHAARRLGVSPVTIRRWTSSGFLPCTRTAGGHRRIAVEDIDDLSRSIGDSTHLAARLARERELDTLVDTAMAVGAQLDLADLLAEIARQMTRLVDCHFCSVAEYDREQDTVTALAEYDATGKRLPTPATYRLHDFPLTRRVLNDQIAGVVNVDDPRADAAEVAALRNEGDRSILMIPLIYRGESIGVVEAIDSGRSRSYSRQELRLCRAVAGQAAIALRNARMFAHFRRSDEGTLRLRTSLSALTRALPSLVPRHDRQALLTGLADVVCDALQAVSCVVSFEGSSAGASRRPPAAVRPSGPAQRASQPALLVAGDPSGQTDMSITVALPQAAVEGQTELLQLVATATALALAGIGSD
jgi:excisionase family DNA binding protein